jgi:hypothetical protein
VDAIDQLAEQRLQEAVQQGEFDDLPGSGRPLELDDDSLVPEELRVAYRLMKNAGYLPPQLQLGKELVEAEQLLSHVDDADARDSAQRRLRCLQLRLDLARGERIDFAVEREYRDRLLRRL